MHQKVKLLLFVLLALAALAIRQWLTWLNIKRPAKTDRHFSFITIGPRQVFCIGDRLKMDKHKAWATTIVATK